MHHPVDDVVAVRRPSRVCFEKPSSPAAVPHKRQPPVVQPAPSSTASSPSSSAARSSSATSSSAVSLTAAVAAAAAVSSITPTDAQPSCVQQHDSVPSSFDSGEVPSDGTSSVIHPYFVELIRTTVQDEMEQVEERLHRDVTSMHVDMLIRIDQVQVCESTVSGPFLCRFLTLVSCRFFLYTNLLFR